MKRQLLAAAAAALLFVPAVGSAQPVTGLYVEGRGGLTLPMDSELSSLGVTSDIEYDAGFNIGAAVGYAHPIGLRGELEIAYQQSDTDQISVGGVSLALDGDVSVLTGLANVYYDIDTGTALTPFIGGGIGIANVSVDVSALGLPLDDDDTVFAYQVSAGVAYAFNPNLSVTLAYRYLGTSDAELTDTDGDTGDWEYASHNLIAGLRYSF